MVIEIGAQVGKCLRKSHGRLQSKIGDPQRNCCNDTHYYKRRELQSGVPIDNENARQCKRLADNGVNESFKAGEGDRTLDINLGKVALYR